MNETDGRGSKVRRTAEHERGEHDFSETAGTRTLLSAVEDNTTPTRLNLARFVLASVDGVSRQQAPQFLTVRPTKVLFQHFF